MTTKGRFWALPGVAAMLGALALASTAEGLSARETTLPRSIQLALPGSPRPPAAGLGRSDPVGESQVVPPSRPVVAQLSPPNPSTATTAPGGRPAVAAHGFPNSTGTGESGDSSGGISPSIDTTPVTTATDDDGKTTTTLGATPDSTTTTSIPATTTTTSTFSTIPATTTTTTRPTTTTTTNPRESGDGGDE
jgi:hypothetical protein